VTWELRLTIVAYSAKGAPLECLPRIRHPSALHVPRVGFKICRLRMRTSVSFVKKADTLSPQTRIVRIVPPENFNSGECRGLEVFPSTTAT
jgi:hypothetical protein